MTYDPADEVAFPETRAGRLLDWLEEHTTGTDTWPWGHIAIGPRHGPLRNRFTFHFPSGHSGAALGFPLPRWLPGFVSSYQIDGPRHLYRGQLCPWWRESDLHAIVPLFPPGRPSVYRTRRLRGPKRGPSNAASAATRRLRRGA